VLADGPRMLWQILAARAAITRGRSER